MYRWREFVLVRSVRQGILQILPAWIMKALSLLSVLSLPAFVISTRVSLLAFAVSLSRACPQAAGPRPGSAASSFSLPASSSSSPRRFSPRLTGRGSLSSAILSPPDSTPAFPSCSSPSSSQSSSLLSSSSFLLSCALFSVAAGCERVLGWLPSCRPERPLSGVSKVRRRARGFPAKSLGSLPRAFLFSHESSLLSPNRGSLHCRPSTAETFLRQQKSLQRNLSSFHTGKDDVAPQKSHRRAPGLARLENAAATPRCTYTALPGVRPGVASPSERSDSPVVWWRAGSGISSSGFEDETAGRKRRTLFSQKKAYRCGATRARREAKRSRRGLASFQMNMAPPGTAFETKVFECRDNPIDTMPWEHVVPFYKVHTKEDNFWLQFLKGNWTYVDGRKMLDKPAGVIDGGQALYDGMGTTLPLNPLAKDRQRAEARPKHLDHGVLFREAFDRPHRITFDRIPCGNSDVYYGETDLDLEERLWGAFHHKRATEEGFPDTGWRNILPQYDMSEMPNPWTHTKGEFIEMPYNSRDPSPGPPVAPIEFDLAAAGRFGGYVLDPGWTRHFDYVEQYNEMQRWLQEEEEEREEREDEAQAEGAPEGEAEGAGVSSAEKKRKKRKRRRPQLLDKPMFREAYERGQLIIKSRYADLRNHPVYKKAIYEGATHHSACIAAERATPETIVDIWKGKEIASDLPKAAGYDHEGGGKWNCEDGEGQTIAINMLGEDIVPHANCYMSPKMSTHEMAELWHFWMTEAHREGRYTDFHSEIGCYSDIEYEDRLLRKRYPRLMALYRPLWCHRKYGDEFGDAVRPDEAPPAEVLSAFGAPLTPPSGVLRRAASRLRRIRQSLRRTPWLSLQEEVLQGDELDSGDRDLLFLRRAALSGRDILSREVKAEQKSRERDERRRELGQKTRLSPGYRRHTESEEERESEKEQLEGHFSWRHETRLGVDANAREEGGDAPDRLENTERKQRRAGHDGLLPEEERYSGDWEKRERDSLADAAEEEEKEDVNFLDEYDMWWLDRGNAYGDSIPEYQSPAMAIQEVLPNSRESDTKKRKAN
ncbi:putative transmembrane protein [Toxoplasma gondii MAS]|uniref:Putative transmembrane protein n=2 Tax=Toxoplasma gondii TaxID=5811 RepID=A0A086PW19_TOXGO|nr:putative transmembrane protein [Toxoplasma gondii MAS]PUA84702.1 putative transmembrane protein [Toxoplasma gondii TgCATBr9]